MNKVRVFDNSETAPVLVYEKNGDEFIYDTARFARIKEELGL
jgi:hypothetical protein